MRHTTLVATLPCRFAADLGADPALVLIAAPPEIAPVSFGMAWHPRLDNDPVHRWLRETIGIAITLQ